MSSTAPAIDPHDEPTADTSQATTAPHQALYRRWRAQTFAEIVGQPAVVETLRNAVRTDRVSHAILFVGPRGTGKTSLARILAKALNCTNLQDGDACDRCPSCVSIREGRAFDLIEIDAASNRGIGDIRDLRDRIQYAPTDLRRKVYILDEAHQITKDAWNALLKSLEEPPPFVAFMFASTHPQDFPPAILSRLQRFDVRRLSVDEIAGKLDRILAAESVSAEPAAIQLIARLAAGGMRDAESILDQVLAAAGRSIEEAQVRDLLGLADAVAIDRLTAALVDGDAPSGVAILADLDDRGRDVSVVLDQVIDQIRVELGTAIGPNGDPDRAAALAAAAHRLAAIDPERRSIGGLRFQVELALLDGSTRRPATVRDAPPPPPAPARPALASPPSTGSTTSDNVPGPTAAETRPAAGPAVPATDFGQASPPAVPGPARRLDATTRRDVPTAAVASPPESARAEPASASSGSRRAAPTPERGPADGPVADAGHAAGSGGLVARGPGIDELRAAWPQIVAVLNQSPPIKPLIAACRPVSLEGAVVTLGFPEDQGFLKDALERRRPTLEAGIGRILGRPVNVRCVATNLEHVPDAPFEEAPDLVSEARRIFADDLADVGEVT